MNFFDHQETARKKSLLLVFLFLIAVALIVAITNLACYLILSVTDSPPIALQEWLSSRLSLSISGALLFTIALGTIHQFLNLSKGGRAVANMANGRKVDISTQDTLEQRYINLVEEMSIASGTMMPELYIMDKEHSINAFVAGYEPTECVLVITKGALETLSRDELQGIIGHEFSHILNGDMRINIRLIAVLAGILLIGQIGQYLMHAPFNRSNSYSARRNKNDVALFFIGITLIAIGYTGLFFGRVIKAAISRQREFLADAASVQFTRNPEGIAGALYKILDTQEGSQLRFTRHAEDINHCCFSESIKLHFSGLLASHPPLKERISTIDTSYLVRFKARKHAAQKQPTRYQATSLEQPATHATSQQALHADPVQSASSSIVGFSQGQSTAREQSFRVSAAALERTTGTVRPAHIDYAKALLSEIPDEIKHLTRTSEGAIMLLLSLMLNETAKKTQEKAIANLSKRAQQNLRSSNYKNIKPLIEAIRLDHRLPIIETSIGSLRKLTQSHRLQLIDDLSTIANTDAKITFFEFALLTLAKQQLAPNHGHKIKSKYHSFNDVGNEVALILSLFATASSKDKKEQASRFNHAMSLFSDTIEWQESPTYNTRKVSHALNKLRLLSPLLKRPLIDSFIDCVMADNTVKYREYELLRLVAVVLDCPMPPLLMQN
ncbi:M48 family metallopeptidase [Alkalimarinus alittae]|uniref:M48 family metallopeptidase n=1 Tax=Alkalimarinus alittae TaxID=2961619 RepID=A0ABY6N5N6_9ALTE|nr:M48 family metallopeptidase [Alkalimarinus alittae]UZE97433.1 M48 family metallopeptidase [Alkalimarinus alittae]